MTSIFRGSKHIEDAYDQPQNLERFHTNVNIHDLADYEDDFNKIMDEDDNKAEQVSIQEMPFSDRTKQFKRVADTSYSVEESGTTTVKDPSITVISSRLNPGRLPNKDESYMPDDERGHIEARSENGLNDKPNIVAQAHDVNHGSYLQMEKGEKNAVLGGADIFSEKIAYVSNQPGKRVDAFMINDTVTYADGKVSDIHLSFQNMQKSEQESYLNAVSKHSDLLNSFNPDDKLREEFSSAKYAKLMNATDSEMVNIANEYDEPDNRKSTHNEKEQLYELSSESKTK